MSALDAARPVDLDGRVVVVPGGTGNVGEGIVRAFAASGALVVVPSRSVERLTALNDLIGTSHPGRVEGRVMGYEDFDAADELAAKVVADHGRVDHVVASIGGWWQGRTMWQIDTADWQRNVVDVMTAHTAVARAFVPRLTPEGSYTMIAGFSARTAYPGAGIVSMAGAALLMMREAFSAELGGQRRVNDLVLGPIVNRSRPQGDPSWLSSDEVGEAAAFVARSSAIADQSITLSDKADLAGLLGGATA